MKTAVLVAVLAALSVQSALAICNNSDGDSLYVNYAAVLYGSVPMCNQGTLPTGVVDYANQGWNDIIGKNVLWRGCLDYGVLIVDRDDGFCGWTWIDGDPGYWSPNPACSMMPSYQRVPELLTVAVVQSLVQGDESSQRHFLGHEQGHTLGFLGDTAIPPYNCDSIMAYCGWAEKPTLFDEVNYYNAYMAEEVTSLTGVSSSPARVDLTWNQINRWGETLCNESGFTVLHGQEVEASLPKDSEVAVLNGEPYGEQNFSVRTLTQALPGAGMEAGVTVGVYGPHLIHQYSFGPSPAKLHDTQGRYMWVLSEFQNPEDFPMPVVISAEAPGGGSSGCSTLEQLILPGSESFTLAAHEEKWVMWRFRYGSCQHTGVWTLRVSTCVREASVDVWECHSENRQLIVRSA